MAEKRVKKKKQSIPSIEQTQKALEELDRVFHEKARLGILTCLISEDDSIDFKQLKQLCGLTDGNLNRHLKVLADAKVVNVKKSGRGRTTNTSYTLTKLGRKSFENYISALETIVRSAKPSPNSSKKKNQSGDISFA